ncbi:MAG TPA: hypothetical protein VFI91_08205 [Longimicrobiaceae bacterium]|nr:hypothetical protein [Longimicrobiaceae bacterium]
MAAGLTTLPGIRRPRGRTRVRARRRPGWIVASLWLTILLGSLVVVTWRQTLGIRMEAAARETQGETAVLEAERIRITRRIEELRSRARVVRVARERLGMHLPTSDEIIFLPAPPADALESRERAP